MMDAPDDSGSPPPMPHKDDPEALVLRGRPRPVVRFRKGVIVGGAAGLSAAVVALTWLALEPHSFRLAANSEGAGQLARTSPDAISGAPSAYSDVPKLGPPLPGDLGRPIVEQQRKAIADARAGSAATDLAAERATAERERRAQAEQAARASTLVVQLSNGRVQEPRAQEAAPPAMAPQVQAAPAQESADKPRLGDWDHSDINSHAVAPAASPWMIAAGTVIAAALVTGLNSDLPGMVVAQVTENVRDSRTGRAVLIPQGARLIGRYDSGVSYGERRAFVIWQRILFPDGASLRLDNMPASDASGYAGLTDRVDGHSWQLIKGVILSSLLGVGTQLSLGGDTGIARAIRESVQQNGSQAGEQIVAKGLSVQPTLKVRPGWPVRVLVSEDLVLEPWKG